MTRHFGWALLLAALAPEPPDREPIPGHCPECGGTGCVPCDYTEITADGCALKACPRGCKQIADEPSGGG